METSSGALRKEEYSSKSRPRILVVDDEKDIRQLLIDYLGEDFDISEAADGSEALSVVEKTTPDMVILDIMIPGLSGFQVLRRLRQTSDIPVIVLSARIDTTDKVEAFELGANDYVTKPFVVDELLARIKAILKRNLGKNKTTRMDFNDGYLTIDFERRRVIVNGKEMNVPKLEYTLLCELVINAGKVVTHEHLLKTIWGTEYISDLGLLHTCISRLRSKIEPCHFHPCYIITVDRVGYLFKNLA